MELHGVLVEEVLVGRRGGGLLCGLLGCCGTGRAVPARLLLCVPTALLLLRAGVWCRVRRVRRGHAEQRLGQVLREVADAGERGRDGVLVHLLLVAVVHEPLARGPALPLLPGIRQLPVVVRDPVRDVGARLPPAAVARAQQGVEHERGPVVHEVDVLGRLGKVDAAPLEAAVPVAQVAVQVERGGAVDAVAVAAVGTELGPDELEGGGGAVEGHFRYAILSNSIYCVVVVG